MNRPLRNKLKIKQAVWTNDKKMFDPPVGGEFFLSVVEDCVVFSYLILNSLDLFASFLGQAKNEEGRMK